MLLRRVMEHVRTQNWTAVAIDFVIVVVGVFIGIQVANWNEARAERVEERQLLKRLHDETHALLELQRLEYADHLPRAEAMLAVHPLLFGLTPTRSLTETECRLIAISHWLPAPTDELPVLEEAISTGRLDLISGENVKSDLRGFLLARDRSRRQYDEAVNELFRLAGRHPNSVWYVHVPGDSGNDAIAKRRRDAAQSARRAGTGYRWSNQCDLKAMRENKAFLAEYVDNVSRLNSYVERYEELVAVLTSLEKTLAIEMGEH